MITEKLRNIVKNLKENNNSEVNAESKKAARVIAVTSGKVESERLI